VAGGADIAVCVWEERVGFIYGCRERRFWAAIVFSATVEKIESAKPIQKRKCREVIRKILRYFINKTLAFAQLLALG
jgi:hypothetical protein